MSESSEELMGSMARVLRQARAKLAAAPTNQIVTPNKTKSARRRFGLSQKQFAGHVRRQSFHTPQMRTGSQRSDQSRENAVESHCARTASGAARVGYDSDSN